MVLFVSLTVSACIFFSVGFHGQYVLFWLVYLVTISIGMGAPAVLHVRPRWVYACSLAEYQKRLALSVTEAAAFQFAQLDPLEHCQSCRRKPGGVQWSGMW